MSPKNLEYNSTSLQNLQEPAIKIFKKLLLYWFQVGVETRLKVNDLRIISRLLHCKFKICSVLSIQQFHLTKQQSIAIHY